MGYVGYGVVWFPLEYSEYQYAVGYVMWVHGCIYGRVFGYVKVKLDASITNRNPILKADRFVGRVW